MAWGNMYGPIDQAEAVAEDTVTMPSIGVSGSFSTTPNGLAGQVQMTGIIVILMVIAVVWMAKKWPVLG